MANNDFRSQLEASWNKEAMGPIPTTPQQAANAARKSFDDSSIQMVHLHIPEYDASNDRLYDPVRAVEFAQELVGGQRVLLLVKDNRTVQTVQKIWKVRDASQSDDYKGADDVVSGAQEDNDVDEFRKQLSSNWELKTPEVSMSSLDEALSSKKPNVELQSLFGDTQMDDSHPDMPSDAVRIVAKNVKVEPSTKVIVAIGCSSASELVALRALTKKYSSRLRFIFINCLFDPLPTEWIPESNLAYSVRPLQLRSVSDQAAPTASVVVLRRAPADWQVYVRLDECPDFECIEEVSALSTPFGPSLEWVAKQVQRFLATSASK